MPSAERSAKEGDLKAALASAAIKELSPEGERGLALLMNKKPRWDKSKGEYCLTMIGRRGNEPSAKNLQVRGCRHIDVNHGWCFGGNKCESGMCS